MPITISAAIMTHPRRLADARWLNSRLGSELDLSLVPDPSPGDAPSAMRSAQAAWQEVSATDVSHCLVLQDDLLPCSGFGTQLRRAIELRPNDVLLLFSRWFGKTAQLVRLAALAGASFAEALPTDLSVAALAMPVDLARRFASHLTTSSTEATRDSLVAGGFFAQHDMQPLSIVPSLVQHDARPLASLLTTAIQPGLRRSACFLNDPPALTNRMLKIPDSLPYLSSNDLRSHIWSRAGPANRRLATEWLPAKGLTMERLRRDFHATLDEHADAFRTVSVSVGMLWEAWLAVAASCIVLRADQHGATTPHSGVARAALSTVLPGALYRVLNADTLTRLAEPSELLLAEAVERNTKAT